MDKKSNNTLYHIHYKSKITNESGFGTGEFSYNEAKEIAEESNQRFPLVHHWVEPTSDEEDKRETPNGLSK